MMINCNVTGNERKRLAQTLGEILSTEPVYTKAPTFAYVLGDYAIDKNGAISFPESAMPVTVAEIVAKLTDAGFSPVLSQDEAPDDSSEEMPGAASAEIPAETPDVAPEAETGAIPQDEVTEAAEGDISPDVAASEEAMPEGSPKEDAPTEDQDDSRLTISIPRAKLTDDALARLKIMVTNKEVLFKRALLTDDLPIEATDEDISFPWFTLTGIDGEVEAYTQFITALCQMAKEQKRVLDKPYDGDNDKFAMRIFMVRLGMKGAQFALARKLMMKHLTGNSGWRYEDSATKPQDRKNPKRATVQHLKNAYPTDTRIELIPMDEESETDIQIGSNGTMIGVDDNGSVFIRLDNGSAFGIAFSTEQADTDDETSDVAPDAETESMPEDDAEVAADNDMSPNMADSEEDISADDEVPITEEDTSAEDETPMPETVEEA